MKLVSIKSAILGTLFSAVVASSSLLAQSSTQLANASPVPAAQDENAPANLSGKWKLSFTAPDGSAKQGELNLQQDGSILTGSFTGPRGTLSTKGNANGNQVTFAISAIGRKLTFSGSADGDKMSGATDKSGSWNASRE